MADRYYVSTALPTELSADLGASGYPEVISLPGDWPEEYPFPALIDWGTASQEAILVTSAPTGTGPYALPCTRGIDDTTQQAHDAGAQVAHGTTGYEPTLIQANATAIASLVSGGAGAVSLAGDLGGTTAAPTVISTHLTAPLPENQGGTNSATQNWQGLLTPVTQTGTYTATPGQLVKANIASSSWTLTLPAAPAANAIAGAKITANATGNTHALTVACGSGDFFEQSGGGTSVTMSLPLQAAAWQYNGGYWTRLSDDLPLPQLDQRYLLTAPLPSGDATGATDTASLQALITSVGDTSTIRAIRINLAPGNYVINATLLAHSKSIELAGAGWGAVSGGGAGIGTTITWAGSAGIPMLRFWACYAIRVSRIKFYGLAAAEPSAAISMYNLSSDSHGNSFNLIEQCWFGSYEGFDGSGNPNSLSCGVLFEGDNVNDDQTTISGCVFYGLTTGVQYSNTQNVVNKIEHCYFYGNAVHVSTVASIELDHTFMASSTSQDLNISDSAVVTCTYYNAEGSAQLAYMRSGASLYVKQGYWQVSNTLAGSSGSTANIVDALNNSTYLVKFEDFRFTFQGYTNPATPQIAMGQVSGGSGTVQLTLENCEGITDASPSTTGVYPFLQSGGNTGCHLLLEGSVALSTAVQTRQRFRIALDDVTVGYTHPVPVSFDTYDIPGAGNTLSAYLAPAVVTLTDASTVTVNAAAGNDFRLTFTSAVGSTRTIGAPSNPVNGQDITFALTQASSGGPYTVTWASGTGGYSFGAGNAPVLSATASQVDLIAFKYVAALQLWCCLGSGLGYSVPAAFVQNVGSATSGTLGSSTYTVTVSAAATTPGNGVILWIRAGAGYYVTAASDTEGNTWTVSETGSRTQANASICSCVIAPGKALVSGDVITLTLNQVQADAASAAGCAEFSGLLTSGGHLVTDKTATAQAGSGTSLTVATSASTAGAAELVISAVAAGGTSPTITPGSSDPDSGGTWNDLALPAAPAVANAAYQITTAVSEFSCTWTSTVTVNANAVIVTYKTAAAAADAAAAIFP